MTSAVLLAIETSQRQGGIALRDREGRVHVERIRESVRHDDDLMPAIDRGFRAAGLKPADLEAVGVSIGPGGFTGLRIAVTTAKMLAAALGAKVLAPPTALVVAESHEKDGRLIVVALASKRETAWVTRLQRGDGDWEIVGEPGLANASGLDLSGASALVGDRYLPGSMRDAAVRLGVPVIEPSFDPAACLAVAARMLEAGRTVAAQLLSPLYPRPPEAVSLWKQRKKGDSEA